MHHMMHARWMASCELMICFALVQERQLTGLAWYLDRLDGLRDCLDVLVWRFHHVPTQGSALEAELPYSC